MYKRQIQQTEDGRGGLVYDTYVVSERNAPAGLLPVEDFEVTVSEEGQTLYYILEDKRVFSPVRLVKKDAETGEVIPIAGAEFQLLDQDKNPVTMTVHYPQETVYSAFKTVSYTQLDVYKRQAYGMAVREIFSHRGRRDPAL